MVFRTKLLTVISRHLVDLVPYSQWPVKTVLKETQKTLIPSTNKLWITLLCFKRPKCSFSLLHWLYQTLSSERNHPKLHSVLSCLGSVLHWYKNKNHLRARSFSCLSFQITLHSKHLIQSVLTQVSEPLLKVAVLHSVAGHGELIPSTQTIGAALQNELPLSS